MVQPLKQIAEWENVTPEIFQRDIVPLYEPAVLKGLVKDWPIVRQAKVDHQTLFHYLDELYVGGKIRCARLAAKYRGRYFYNEQMTGLNFTREIMGFDTFFHQLIANANDINCDTLALQSAPMQEYFPSFSQHNAMTLFNETIQPRIWIGGNTVVNAHHDDAENIACVVSGKRRFTLFPPNQIDNLYIGPMETTPAGAPISLVDFSEPDFATYPKFKKALAHALSADLSPGDAIYIPSLWWHHVQSSGGVNTLVNYWQGGAIGSTKKPVPQDNLLMAMLTIRDLPQQQKDAWRSFFDYYIFSSQNEKNKHIPEQLKGILGDIPPERQADIRQWLIKQLTK